MYLKDTTTDDLLRRVLEKLLRQRSSVKATRGLNAEQIGAMLRLTNPRARLSHTEKRGKIFSCVGELLWYLSGSNSLDFIGYYIKEYIKDSEDGKTVYGGYGPRIFSMDGINQITSIVSLLHSRPESRRAVIQLFDAKDIAEGIHRKEIPCTCTWQFFSRNGLLHMATHMRSNDAFIGLSHDLFTFTMIQEIVARTLKLELGTYTHIVGSLHLYNDQREDAQKYVDEGWQSTKDVAMRPMPPGDPWASIKLLVAAEKRIRRGQEPSQKTFTANPYWLDLVRLLQIFRCSKSNELRRVSVLRRQMSSPVFDAFIAKREKQRRRVPASGQFRLPYAAPPDGDSRE